jgi:hypothetical protein
MREEKRREGCFLTWLSATLGQAIDGLAITGESETPPSRAPPSPEGSGKPASSEIVGYKSTSSDKAGVRRPTDCLIHGARTNSGTRVPASELVILHQTLCSPVLHP